MNNVQGVQSLYSHCNLQRGLGDGGEVHFPLDAGNTVAEPALFDGILPHNPTSCA